MSIPRRNVDIAIIGMSCRFPGAATAAEYWKNLCDGVESITFFSDQELIGSRRRPDIGHQSRLCKGCADIAGCRDVRRLVLWLFPKDAALMDPQHRLFLEVCWEAFENAGYDPADYPGKVGVLPAVAAS